MNRISTRFLLAIVCSITAFSGAGCDSKNAATNTTQPTTYSVGGSVSGLSTSGLVLSNNGITAPVTANATTFVFPTLFVAGSNYAVTVQTQPTGLTCSVANGSGTVGTANVTTVQVTCTSYSLGGSISGLTTGGLVLANGTDTVSPPAGATSFTFPTKLPTGANYSVTISTQPAGRSCQVVNGSGTVGSSNVTSVAVGCSGEWAWMAGPNSANSGAQYGLQGVSSPSNVPGARQYMGSWTAANGDFWVFGGVGTISGGFSTGPLNDLWKYSPQSGEWTWEAGSQTWFKAGVYGTLGQPDASNAPGGRSDAASWTDAGGNYWVYGGYGVPAVPSSASPQGDLSDLWEFSPTTGLWTWQGGSQAYNAIAVYGTQGVSSAANLPGPRQGTSTWTDSHGNLWLFGGANTPTVATGNPSTSYFNDVWSYSPASGGWTWVTGPNTANDAGTYGTQGVAAASNAPRARTGAASWTDGSGNFWLFGGSVCTVTVSPQAQRCSANDLWEYSPGINQWKWLGGPSTGTVAGTYGTLGLPAASSLPGGRFGAVTWTDSAGNLWLYGGFGADSAGTIGNLSDLWEYQISSGNWIWMAGPPVVGSATAVWGSKGTAAAGNTPGGRMGAKGSIDANSNLWLYGGYGVQSGGVPALYGDIWKFTP